MNEPDKFEQFTAWLQEVAAGVEAGFNWLIINAGTLASVSASVVMILAILLVASPRRRNPEVSGMRHARR